MVGGGVVLHWFSRSCISLTRADPSAVLHRCCSSICFGVILIVAFGCGCLFGFMCCVWGLSLRLSLQMRDN